MIPISRESSSLASLTPLWEGRVVDKLLSLKTLVLFTICLRLTANSTITCLVEERVRKNENTSYAWRPQIFRRSHYTRVKHVGFCSHEEQIHTSGFVTHGMCSTFTYGRLLLRGIDLSEVLYQIHEVRQ